MAKFYSYSSIKVFLLFLIIPVFSTQIVYGKEPPLFSKLKKITLFKSTRQDVEKIFKFESFKEVLNYNYPDWLFSEEAIEEAKNNPAGYYTVYYDLKGGALSVNYSKGRCSENNKQGYNLEKDIVINARLSFADSVKISKLNLDLTKFKRIEYNSDLVGEMAYKSSDLGIDIDGVGKYVNGIEVLPVAFQDEKYGCEKYTADTVMEKTFNEKRDVFEKLLQMSDEDHEIKVISARNARLKLDSTTENYNLSSNPANLSMQRLYSYRGRLKELNMKLGMVREEEQNPKGIYFRSDFKIYSFATGEKGYIYTKDKPAPLVESIDAIIEKVKNDEDTSKDFFRKEQRLYKRIADNWFLYFDYEID